MARLGDYVTIRTGKLDANASSENGKYPFFTCSVTPLKIDIYSYDCECVLVAGNGDLNVKYYNGKFDAYQRTYIIESNDKSVLSVPYLYCFLDKYVETLRTQAIGGVIKYIKLGNLTEAQISLISLEEQNKIVNNLGKINALISETKKQLGKLEELVKSRFIELFGAPATNPMDWKLHRFDSLCENLDSRRKPITASERVAGIYPYYGASGIVDYVADYIFDENILLVSEDGANLLMRSTPIAFSVSGKAWVNNHAHVVRFKKMSLQKYIEVFFSLIDISDYVTGSAQPKLNQAKLNSMMFPLPSDERLETFLRFIEQTDKSKFDVQQSLEKLETLKKSLMQQYFG